MLTSSQFESEPKRWIQKLRTLKHEKWKGWLPSWNIETKLAGLKYSFIYQLFNFGKCSEEKNIRVFTSIPWYMVYELSNKTLRQNIYQGIWEITANVHSPFCPNYMADFSACVPPPALQNTSIDYLSQRLIWKFIYQLSWSWSQNSLIFFSLWATLANLGVLL